MSFPGIPNISPTISLTTAQTIPLLLASIALEELSLAHIMNAEAEKLQFVLGTITPAPTTALAETSVSLSNLLAIDSSVQRTLRDVIKKEMLLEFKFENVLELIATIPPSTCPTPTSTATVPGDGSFTLNFLGVTTLANGQQEWTYSLTNNTPNALSHWTFVPCGPITVVNCTAETTQGVPIDVDCNVTMNPGASIPCLLGNNFGIEVHPAADAHDAGETIIYHIFTAQVYPVGTILWGAKSANNTACGQICGPCPA